MLTDARRARLCGDDGSALMLLPAAVLVVLVLGAITVDLGAVRVAQRRLADAADAAANDGVTVGLDRGAYFRDGGYRLDPDRVDAVVADSLAVHGYAGRLTDLHVEVVGAGDQVRVEVATRSSYVFAKALPGTRDGVEVRAVATATAHRR